jgi:hypothetical protein
MNQMIQREMTMPRLRRLSACLAVSLLPLAACAQLPPDYSPNYVYVPVAEPGHPNRVHRVLMPEACLVADPTDGLLGPRVPPGCANNANLLAMVERKQDVVRGRNLGPAPAAPSARAAQKYIYGTPATLGAGVPPRTAVTTTPASSTEPVPGTGH